LPVTAAEIRAVRRGWRLSEWVGADMGGYFLAMGFGLNRAKLGGMFQNGTNCILCLFAGGGAARVFGNMPGVSSLYPELSALYPELRYGSELAASGGRMQR